MLGPTEKCCNGIRAVCKIEAPVNRSVSDYPTNGHVPRRMECGCCISDNLCIYWLIMVGLPASRVGLGGIFSISICFYFFPGLLLGFAQGSNPTIEVLEAEAAEHRIGTRGPIYTNLGQGELALTLEPVTLEVVVGTDGKTLDAIKTSGFIFGDLTLLWKTWQYKPFERNGHPVVAKVLKYANLSPFCRSGSVLRPTFPFLRFMIGTRCESPLAAAAAMAYVPPMRSKFMVTERFCMKVRRSSEPRGEKW